MFKYGHAAPRLISEKMFLNYCRVSYRSMPNFMLIEYHNRTRFLKSIFWSLSAFLSFWEYKRVKGKINIRWCVDSNLMCSIWCVAFFSFLGQGSQKWSLFSDFHKICDVIIPYLGIIRGIGLFCIKVNTSVLIKLIFRCQKDGRKYQKCPRTQ